MQYSIINTAFVFHSTQICPLKPRGSLSNASLINSARFVLNESLLTPTSTLLLSRSEQFLFQTISQTGIYSIEFIGIENIICKVIFTLFSIPFLASLH